MNSKNAVRDIIVTALISLVLHKEFKVAISAVFSNYDLNITFTAER